MALGLPIILNQNFEKQGTIDTYVSFIWTSRYYNAGDFELTCNVDEKSMELLKVGNYVYHEQDDNIGIIESIEAEVTDTRRFYIIASGRFLPAILARRIVAEQTQLTGLLSDSIYALLNDAIIDPVIESRRIPDFVHTDYQTTETVDKQITGDNLLEAVSGLCMTYQYGFNVTRNDAGQFVFGLYKGVDRSYDQDVNSWVIFSDEYDNLLSSTLISDRSNMVTDVLVAGQGEGTERITAWSAKDSQSGLDRYEYYKDARQIRSNDTLTESEYLDTLRQEGLANITEYTESFSGNVDFNNVKYKTDIFLGDVCSIENTKMGVYINPRLVEVIESIDEGGKYTILPTFGL